MVLYRDLADTGRILLLPVNDKLTEVLVSLVKIGRI